MNLKIILLKNINNLVKNMMKLIALYLYKHVNFKVKDLVFIFKNY